MITSSLPSFVKVHYKKTSLLENNTCIYWDTNSAFSQEPLCEYYRNLKKFMVFFLVPFSSQTFLLIEKTKDIRRSRMTNSEQQALHSQITQRSYKNVRIHNDYGPT